MLVLHYSKTTVQQQSEDKLHKPRPHYHS